MNLTAPPVPRARLLSFDGGGIRGLFALEIARRIETLLREAHGKPDLVLADHFACLLYTMATLPEYRLNWPDGKERMSLVSSGTGREKTGRGSKLEQNLLGQAMSVPAALISSAQWIQDLLCRQHGECRHGAPLDNIELMDFLCEMGANYAGKHVSLDHFDDVAIAG